MGISLCVGYIQLTSPDHWPHCVHWETALLRCFSTLRGLDRFDDWEVMARDYRAGGERMGTASFTLLITTGSPQFFVSFYNPDNNSEYSPFMTPSLVTLFECSTCALLGPWLTWSSSSVAKKWYI